MDYGDGKDWNLFHQLIRAILALSLLVAILTITLLHGMSGFEQVSPQGVCSGEQCKTFVEKVVGDPIALFTLVLTLFTGGLFWATLALWAATRNLVAGADRTAERQLRAYLAADKILFRRDKNRMYYEIGVKNFGNTPAHKIEIFMDTSLRASGDNKGFTRPLVSTLYGIMAPTEKVVVGTDEARDFEADEFSSIEKGQLVLYIFGAIHYFDVFERPRQTSFRWKTTHRDFARGKFVACVDGNEAN